MKFTDNQYWHHSIDMEALDLERIVTKLLAENKIGIEAACIAADALESAINDRFGS